MNEEYDFVKELDKFTEYNKGSFAFSTSNGYIVDIFKTNPKDKSYGLFVGLEGENRLYKVGLVRDVKLFRKAMLGGGKC